MKGLALALFCVVFVVGAAEEAIGDAEDDAERFIGLVGNLDLRIEGEVKFEIGLEVLNRDDSFARKDDSILAN